MALTEAEREFLVAIRDDTGDSIKVLLKHKLGCEWAIRNGWIYQVQPWPYFHFRLTPAGRQALAEHRESTK